MIHVTESEVARLLSRSKAIELVRKAYLKLAEGEAICSPRTVLSVPGGASMYFMPAHVYGEDTVTVKIARAIRTIRLESFQRSS